MSLSRRCTILSLLLGSICLLHRAPARHCQMSGAPDEGRVKLGVFMESLCPDSRRFFNQQLVPTYREVGSMMELKLVPFGHARTLADGKMVCQHGPRECEGNRRMACVLSSSKNESHVVDTIACLFAANDSVRGCIDKNLPGHSYQDIENCTKSDASYQLMVKAERETGRVAYVPHLTVNGQWSNEIQDEAEHELKKLVCRKYRGPRPSEACSKLAAGGAATSEPDF